MSGIVYRVAALMTAAFVCLSGGVASQTPSMPGDRYADIPGARLFYLDTGGNGVPVVLLHSATGSARVWEHQLEPFRSAGYRVVAYDRRGVGRTTGSSPDGRPPSAADDLEALVSVLGLERFHLVGTAAGGIVAIDYALSFAHRLRSLVVANSLGGVVDEDYVAMGRRLRPPEFSSLPPDFRELGPAYRAANPEGTRRWLELEHVSRVPGPPPPAQPAKNRVTFASLERLRVPTLLITGGADLYTPGPALRLFAERIPSSQSLVLPDVGHSAYWEAPDAFNRAVMAFIGKR